MPANDRAPERRESARAKLTRTLRVTGRRDDGYHLLEAEMLSLDLADELVMQEREEANSNEPIAIVDAVRWVGAEVPGAESAFALVPAGPSNLVAKALGLVGRRASVTLTKRIPAGAGLGGGSADAAAVLRWAGADDPVAAANLGADVPFCVHGGRALVRGIGEQLEPLAFEEATFLVCTPALAVSTALVYRAFDELGPPRSDGPNDLEAAALAVLPALAWWRDLIGEVVGHKPVLAGSGASWFVECSAAVADREAAALREAVTEADRRAAIEVCHATEAY